MQIRICLAAQRRDDGRTQTVGCYLNPPRFGIEVSHWRVVQGMNG